MALTLTSLPSRHCRRQENTYGWGDVIQRSCLLLQLFLVVTIISCATAKTKTATLPSHSYSRIDDVVLTDANHKIRYDVTTRLKTNRVCYGIPSTSTFNNKEVRGGETSKNNYVQNVVNAGSNEIEHNAKYHLSKILSFIFLMIDQTINVASAAFVASGYFGALVASWMIRKMHRALPILISKGYIVGNNSVGTNGDAGWGIVSSLLGKYRLTSLATIGFALLRASGIQSDQDGFGQISDAVFVTIMWYYSRGVNPVIGGMIGCAHIALSISSIVLGNRRLINSLDHLGDIRLEKLGQYGDEEEIENDPYVDPIKYERVSKEPVIVAGESSNKITKIIAQNMDSASLLITFPQTFLGLYMFGMLNDMLNDVEKSELFNCWKLDTGFCLLKLSTRLVALHWIVAIIKISCLKMSFR